MLHTCAWCARLWCTWEALHNGAGLHKVLVQVGGVACLCWVCKAVLHVAGIAHLCWVCKVVVHMGVIAHLWLMCKAVLHVGVIAHLCWVCEAVVQVGRCCTLVLGVQGSVAHGRRCTLVLGVQGCGARGSHCTLVVDVQGSVAGGRRCTLVLGVQINAHLLGCAPRSRALRCLQAHGIASMQRPRVFVHLFVSWGGGWGSHSPPLLTLCPPPVPPHRSAARWGTCPAPSCPR